MFRVRDAEEIGRVGKYQIKQAAALEAALQKLKQDMNEVLINYDSAAARETINAFSNGVDNYMPVVEKIRNYGMYQEAILNHDSENLDKANKNVNHMLNEPIDQTAVSEPLPSDVEDVSASETVLNLDNIIGGDNDGQ